MTEKPSIAIVYDRVNKLGGAERLLQLLHETFPQAPLYTSVFNEDTAPWAKGWDTRTTWLQKIPFFRRRHELAACFMPIAFESLKLDGFDVVISVTSEAAKGVLTGPKTKHLCWMLTPTRYLWSGKQEYEHDYFRGWRRALLPLYRQMTFYLQEWDLRAVQRPDQILSISPLVQERVQRYYNRSSQLLVPGVDGSFFQPTPKPEKVAPFFLVVARLVPYKKTELCIAACIRLRHKLIIVGAGSEKTRLQALARNAPWIEFQENVNDARLLWLYQHCSAFLFPAADDFGLTVLEAMACGKPVVVYRKSGNAFVVRPGQDGIYLDEQTVSSMVHSIQKLMGIAWNASKIRHQALQFSRERCKQVWKELVL